MGTIWHTVYARLPKWLARKCRFIPVLSNKYVWSFLVFGLPVFLLFNFGYFRSWKPTAENLPVLISIYIASFWIWLGPILTLAWEEAYDKFVTQVRQYAARHKIDTQRFESTLKYWRILPLLLGAVYVALGLFLHLSYRPLISDLMDIPYGSTIFYTTNLVLIFSGYVTGIGVAGVLHTILLYRSLSRTSFRWEPFHPDQRGGLAFLSFFALTTSTLFLGGITVVPAMISMAMKVQGLEALAGYVAILLYASLIAAIFFWPMSIIANKAVAEKETYLVGLSRIITDELDKVSPNAGTLPDAASPYINPSTAQLIDLYDRIKVVSVQPYSMATFVKVIGNSLLPILFAAAQILIEASGVIRTLFPFD